MAQITYANMLSESRNSVVAIINSDVTDPIISSKENRKFIYSREPDVNSTKFAGYPLIIVHPSRVEIEKGGSICGKKKFVSWNVDVEIFTSDRGYGVSGEGNGLSYMESISDDIMQAFCSITNRKTLISYGMAFSQPVFSSINTEAYSNELIYRRSVTLSFRNRIAVSA